MMKVHGSAPQCSKLMADENELQLQLPRLDARDLPSSLKCGCQTPGFDSQRIQKRQGKLERKNKRKVEESREIEKNT